MSEVIIVLILLIPVFLVIFVLNRSRNKQKKADREKLSAYVNPLLRQHGLSPSFQKELVHQHVAVDEKEGKLLLIQWKDFDFSHELHFLHDIRKLSVQTIRQNVIADNKGKPEILTAEVGIEMTLDKTDEKRFLTFYSHYDHNISQLAGFTAEATQLCERLRQSKAGRPSAA